MTPLATRFLPAYLHFREESNNRQIVRSSPAHGIHRWWKRVTYH